MATRARPANDGVVDRDDAFPSDGGVTGITFRLDTYRDMADRQASHRTWAARQGIAMAHVASAQDHLVIDRDPGAPASDFVAQAAIGIDLDRQVTKG